MSRDSLVSRFRHRAFRYVPEVIRHPNIVTALDIRHARFLVGQNEDAGWDHLEAAKSAPTLRAFYLGRVEEVAGDAVATTIWEVPSGREAATALSVDEHFAGKAPSPGDFLRIWTWVELPGQGREEPRFIVNVEER